MNVSGLIEHTIQNQVQKTNYPFWCYCFSLVVYIWTPISDCKGRPMKANQPRRLNSRLDKLEEQGVQELLVLVEILSTATFFGDLKRNNCEHAKDGQCGFYFIKNKTENKIPVTSDCRIKDCKNAPPHHHIELSTITCTLCPKWQEQTQTDQTNTNQQSYLLEK